PVLLCLGCLPFHLVATLSLLSLSLAPYLSSQVTLLSPLPLIPLSCGRMKMLRLSWMCKSSPLFRYSLTPFFLCVCAGVCVCVNCHARGPHVQICIAPVRGPVSVCIAPCACVCVFQGIREG